ncbi:MAG: diaminopimelate epimerase [Candidatus Thiodiazotropha sp.]
MKLRFTKMHGAGNDFVVIDGVRQDVPLDPELCRRLADRRFGVGCDQILLVEPPRQRDTDFHYRIINADGSDAGACGNGARCFVRFVHEQGLSDKPVLRVTTSGGLIELRELESGQIEVDMGPPRFEPAQIPFNAAQRATRYPLEVAGETVNLSSLSMGNPHAVLMVDDVDQAPVAHLGPAIENHPRFPERVNVGFMQVLNPREIRLRVFERGTGETLACGSGACAAVVAGRLLGRLEETVTVHLRGGDLVIKWPGEGHSVLLSGPAQTVFQGTIEL